MTNMSYIFHNMYHQMIFRADIRPLSCTCRRLIPTYLYVCYIKIKIHLILEHALRSSQLGASQSKWSTMITKDFKPLNQMSTPSLWFLAFWRQPRERSLQLRPFASSVDLRGQLQQLELEEREDFRASAWALPVPARKECPSSCLSYPNDNDWHLHRQRKCQTMELNLARERNEHLGRRTCSRERNP